LDTTNKYFDFVLNWISIKNKKCLQIVDLQAFFTKIKSGWQDANPMLQNADIQVFTNLPII
jgi:hypothetical protein